MGEIVATDNGKIDREVVAVTGTAGGSGKSSSAADTSTGGNTGGRTGGNTAGGNTGGENGQSTEKIDELALLTEEEKRQYATADDTERKRLIRNAKRRERYKNEKGGNVKPKKVNKKKASEPVVDNATINMLIATLSTVVSSRPDCEHWALSEKEINSISEPLSKMLQEYDAFSNIGQYSNQIALVMACVTVFMPRVFISLNKVKEKKKNVITGNRTDVSTGNIVTGRNLREEKTSDKKPTGRNDGQSTDNGTKHVNDVSLYGLPIY